MEITLRAPAPTDAGQARETTTNRPIPNYYRYGTLTLSVSGSG